MALSDSLNNKTEQQLVDDDAFINALVGKLKAGADDNGVYTKKGVNDELGKKADTTALATKVEKTYVDTELGKKADTTALATKVEKTYVDTELGKKADTTALATKVEKTYVDTELGKKADTTALATKVEKTYVDTELGKKADIDGTNLDDAKVNSILNKLTDKVVKTSQLETPAVAGKVLAVEDGGKSVLVDKLGGFLDASDAVYGTSSNQTAKVFLGGKGLKGDKGEDGTQGLKGDKGDPGADGKSPSAAEIAADPTLQVHVAKISIKSPEFKKAVQEEMSQPHFDIPASDDAALNWTW